VDGFPGQPALCELWHLAACAYDLDVILLTTLTLTLIYPASNWTHWATLGHHLCLSRAATSASSQVNAIFRRSLLTTVRSSSVLLIDLVLSCNLVPASTVAAVNYQ